MHKIKERRELSKLLWVLIQKVWNKLITEIYLTRYRGSYCLLPSYVGINLRHGAFNISKLKLLCKRPTQTWMLSFANASLLLYIHTNNGQMWNKDIKTMISAEARLHKKALVLGFCLFSNRMKKDSAIKSLRRMNKHFHIKYIFFSLLSCRQVYLSTRLTASLYWRLLSLAFE